MFLCFHRDLVNLNSAVFLIKNVFFSVCFWVYRSNSSLGKNQLTWQCCSGWEYECVLPAILNSTEERVLLTLSLWWC